MSGWTDVTVDNITGPTPLVPGNYKLTGNIEVDGPLNLVSGTVIDLSGYTISAPSTYVMQVVSSAGDTLENTALQFISNRSLSLVTTTGTTPYPASTSLTSHTFNSGDAVILLYASGLRTIKFTNLGALQILTLNGALTPSLQTVLISNITTATSFYLNLGACMNLATLNLSGDVPLLDSGSPTIVIPQTPTLTHVIMNECGLTEADIVSIITTTLVAAGSNGGTLDCLTQGGSTIVPTPSGTLAVDLQTLIDRNWTIVGYP